MTFKSFIFNMCSHYCYTTFTFFWLSLVTGRLVDRYGPKPLLVGAALSLAAGLWATSTVNSAALVSVTSGVRNRGA